MTRLTIIITITSIALLLSYIILKAFKIIFTKKDRITELQNSLDFIQDL